jgi:RNA polymerase sigma factor (sigma-70 family)
MSSITVEELLEHSDWLRTLAFRLITDPGTAEDVVQETWLAALRRPPSKRGPPRPWLGKVLRNVIRNRHRAQIRRGDREALALAEPVIPTPGELAREAEGQRIIAEAVAALPEPHRSVVVLRYFRGLDSSEIGRMRGVSASTVRGQLRHALDELRGRLDREHGGRKSWAVLLLPFLPTSPTVTPTTTTATAMASTFWLKIALAVTALMFVPLFGGQFLSGPTPTTSTKSASNLAASSTAIAVLEPAPTEARVSIYSSPTITDGAEGEPATVRGSFQFPDGSPVASLNVEISVDWTADDQQSFRGVPDFVDGTSPVTDGAGHFEVSFETARTFSCRVSAKHPDHVLDRWSFRELQQGTRLDLGTVTLQRPGAIEGVLVREDGTPLTGESWKMYGYQVLPGGMSGRVRVSASVEVDRETGSFRLEELPPGTVSLRARSRLAGWVDGPALLTISDETIPAEVVYSGPDNSRRIAVSVRNELMSPLSTPGRGSIVLHGTAGGDISAASSSTVPGQYVFDDLEPGSYDVEIVDPRFQPWSQAGVLTGSAISAKLVGSCSLRWRDAQGSPLKPLSVTVECLEVTYTPPWLSERGGQEVVAAMFMPNRAEVNADDDHLSGDRLIGLVPGSWRVHIDAGDEGTTTLEISDLVAGEERLVELAPAFGSASGIAGLVREEDGSPAVGVEVWLLHSAEENDSPASLVLYPGTSGYPLTEFRKPVTRTITDEDGVFAFDHPGAGSFALVAQRTELFADATEAFSVEANEAQTDLELTLPAEAVLVGHLVGPPGCSTEGLHVLVAPASLTPDSLPFAMFTARAARSLDATGSFRSQTLPTGAVIPYLRLPLDPSSPSGGHLSIVTHGDGGLKHELALEAVQLVAGTNEVELELFEEFPGCLEVTVIGDGNPLSGVKVELGPPIPPFGRGGRRGFTDPAGGAARIVDFPGSRSLEISDDTAGWRYRHPDTVQVIAGTATPLEIEIELATAELIVHAANGEPLAGAAIQITFPEGHARDRIGGVKTTDPDGAVETTLTPGEYTVYLLAEDASDQEAVKAASKLLYREAPLPPLVYVTWTGAGAQVQFEK